MDVQFSKFVRTKRRYISYTYRVQLYQVPRYAGTKKTFRRLDLHLGLTSWHLAFYPKGTK